MNSAVFTGIMLGLVVGAIFGYVLSRVQDTRYINEISDFAIEKTKKILKEDEELIKELFSRNKKLTDENNRLQLELVKTFNPKADFPEGFFDVNDLPDHFNDDIDFGGKF